MASSSQIRAGAAFVELNVRDNLRAGLARALVTLRGFANIVKSVGGGFMAFGKAVADVGAKMQGLGMRTIGVGAAIAGAMGLAIRAFVRFGSEVEDAATRTGIAVEALSELRYAAQHEEVAFEALQKSLHRMQRTLADAAGGSQSAADALGALGLTVADLAGMSPDRQFELIADRIAAIKDPALRTAAAMKIFGRRGAEMLPLLRQGAAGIQGLRKEAQDLGIQMSTQDAVVGSAVAAAGGADTSNFAKLQELIKQGNLLLSRIERNTKLLDRVGALGV